MLYLQVTYILVFIANLNIPTTRFRRFPGRRINESETFKLSVQVVAAFLGFEDSYVLWKLMKLRCMKKYKELTACVFSCFSRTCSTAFDVFILAPHQAGSIQLVYIS